MPEVSEILNQLFVQGINREQFIQKYKELSAKEEYNSIFLDNVSDETIGYMFDSFHKSSTDGSEDVITEEDIKTIRNFDNNDEDISLEDLKQVYENALNSPSEMQIDTRRSLLEQIAASRKSMIEEEIQKLEDKKNENTRKQQELYDKKLAEIEKNEKLIEQKKVDLKQASVLKDELDSKTDELEKETDENKKAHLHSEVENLKIKCKSYDAIERDIKRLEKSVAKDKSSLSKIKDEIDKKNAPIDKQIKDKKEEIKEVEEQLQLDLEDLLVDDLEAQQQNATQIASIKDFQSGMRYDNIKGTFNASEIDYLKNGNEVKGVKYSSEKGQKLAKDMASHSVGFTGYCGRYVRQGLERTGLSNGQRRVKYAKDMDTVLDDNDNFVKISVTSAEDLKKLPAGCILVYEANAAGYSSQCGHIEVTLGDGTACSDGRTRNLRYSNRMSVYVPVDNA